MKTAEAVAKTRESKPCPITLSQFRAGARLTSAQIDGQSVAVAPKEFKTGSFGFFGHGKVTVVIGGVAVPCQAQISLQAIHSKEAAK